MVCYYHRQEKKVSVTQGTRLIIGPIKRISILISALGSLQAQISCCVDRDENETSRMCRAFFIETHYRISMMQNILKTRGSVASEGNWLCFAKALHYLPTS